MLCWLQTNGPSYDNDLPNAAAAPTEQLDANANHDNTELDNDQQSDCNGMEDGTGYEGFAKFLRKNQCCDAPENNLEEFPQLSKNQEIIIEVCYLLLTLYLTRLANGSKFYIIV